MSVLAVSCAKENVEGTDTGVSFTIEVPGAPATKTIGDGLTAKKLYYQVFDGEGNAISGLGVQDTPITGKTATVKFQLIKDCTYNFVFWAQTDVPGYYSFDSADGLKKITADYGGKSANDENFDAFCAVEEVTVTGPVTKSVVLKRPFAQLNIATSDKIKAGDAEKDVDFTGATTAVTVKSLPNVFSPLAATDVFTGNEDVTFAAAEIPAGNITVNGETYRYLSVNYLFAPVDGTVYDINAKLKVEGKDVSLNVPAVPVKQNWRTNIVGSLLTAGTDFSVVVDPVFGGDEDLDLVNIRNVASLKALFSNGGSAKLDADIELVDEAMAVLPGKSVVLNLNGHKIVNRVLNVPAIKVGGKLELDGDGTVDGGEGGNNNALCAMTGSELIIKGGTYTVGGDANNLANSCIYSLGGDVTIYGGYFRSECTYRNRYYVLNMHNSNPGSITVYGGKFENYDPTTGDDFVPSGFVADGYTVTASYDAGSSATVYAVVKATATATDETSLLSSMSKTGAVVVLNDDIDITYVPVSKRTTLNLNGSTINCNADDALRANKGSNLSIVGNGSIKATAVLPDKQVSGVSVRNGGTVNIYDGVTIDGGSGSKGNNAVRIVYGTVNIYGGYFHSGLDKDGNSSEVIYLESGYNSSWKATLNIYGGVFECDGDARFLINMQDSYRSKCSAKIYGGTFVGFNPADNSAEGEHTNFVAAGYKSVETTYDGKQAWKVEKE